MENKSALTMSRSSSSHQRSEDSRLAATFLRPLQTQFYVPDNGGGCAAKRLIDFSLNPPMSDETDALELRSAAESLISSMHCSFDGQKACFHLSMKTVNPMKSCHLLLRCKYHSKDGVWKELAFQSKLNVWNKCDATLFWARRDLVQRDPNYRDRYRILVDFDLVHCDWLEEKPRFASKGTQVGCHGIDNLDAGASPKKVRQPPEVSEDRHHPDSNLTVEVEGRLLYTFCDLLSVASPVFARILSQAAASDDASSQLRIQLPGKSAAEVEELLKLLHPATPHRLSQRMAPAILVLADEYQIDHIKDTAESLISASYLHWDAAYREDRESCQEEDRPCPMEGYALARAYNCRRLERLCLRLLMAWSVDCIERNPAFKRMDKEDRCALAMARMKLMEAGNTDAASAKKQ